PYLGIYSQISTLSSITTRLDARKEGFRPLKFIVLAINAINFPLNSITYD
ncbi:MAG: hypothetical protein ACJASY_003559, partial [Halioglobus sp.]